MRNLAIDRRPAGPSRKLGSRLAGLCLLLLMAACSSRPPSPSPPAGEEISGRMQPMSWQALPGWPQDNAISAWSAFRASCTQLADKPAWSDVCADAKRVDPLDNRAITRFFEQRFAPYRMVNDDGSTTGTITGYYEPRLQGSRYRHGRYQVPLYRLPADWAQAPGKTRPARAELLASQTLRGQELVWVDDPIEAAYLQIQGSGRVELAEGGVMRVGFAGTNNQPFRSFARALIERGEITPGEATLLGIRDWARRNPQQVDSALAVNPRMVFFQSRGIDPQVTSEGPVGALGVPLTSQRSLAVDPSRIPLGAPVFLATTQPLSEEPLQRLMVAQDTGSAIKGSVRADFFWGYGDQAGENAGRMKQPGQLWVLMPKAR